MHQNQNTGATANHWGRTTARAIAEKMGACLLSKNSNECLLNGTHAVIKCGKPNTDSVGVTYKMLERLDVVIGAFETENDNFEVYRLPKQHFEAKMRPTASQGSAKGKVGILRKSEFELHGTYLGKIAI